MTVFYDDFEKASLWGKDLAVHADTVYRKNARYCIVGVSQAYVRKTWTRHEIRGTRGLAIEPGNWFERVRVLRLDAAMMDNISLCTLGHPESVSSWATWPGGTRISTCGADAAEPAPTSTRSHATCTSARDTMA